MRGLYRTGIRAAYGLYPTSEKGTLALCILVSWYVYPIPGYTLALCILVGALFTMKHTARRAAPTHIFIGINGRVHWHCAFWYGRYALPDKRVETAAGGAGAGGGSLVGALSEVGELDVAVRVEEDVLGLEVAVDHVTA